MRAFLGSRALRHTLLFLALSAAWFASGWQADLAILAAGLGAIRLATLLLFRAALPAAGVAAPRIAEEVTLLAACVAWTMLRLRLAGLDLGSVVTASAVITAVAAFAMQDTLGNVLAGLFLELDHSISVGDWVRLDELSGRVVEIRWRHTAIRTRTGEIAIVPNAALMKSRFLVMGNPDSGPTRLRRSIGFDIGFDVPAGKVMAAAEQALAGAEIANVLPEPRPSCVLQEFTASDCRYALRYWLRDPQADDLTDSAVRVHLLAALQRAGIRLRMPEFFVHQIDEDEARRTAREARETERRAAALQAVELFSPLTAEERRSLAQRLVPAPFAAGDVITRQGAVAHWLYLLIGGNADVWVQDGDGQRRRVAALAAGDVFGEMGMMTGEPRRATVTARSDVECYRLDKAAFADILRARPAIAETMSRVLAARAGALHQAAEEARSHPAARLHAEGLLDRIRSFFGLPAGLTTQDLP